MKTKEKLLVIYVMTLTFLINFTTKVSARAGKSSSRRSSHRSTSHSYSGNRSLGRSYRRNHYYSNGYRRHHAGFLGLNLTGFITTLAIIILIILIVYMIKKKGKPSYNNLKSKRDKVYEELSYLKVNDLAWDIDFINKNFEEIFMSVQNAWTNRDMDLAGDYISQKIRTAYELKLKNMKRKHEINVLKDIEIIEAFPVKASDKSAVSPYKSLSILVTASLIDYYADDESLEIKSGSTERTSFTEVWNLIYVNNKWILNSIKQTTE